MRGWLFPHCSVPFGCEYNRNWDLLCRLSGKRSRDSILLSQASNTIGLRTPETAERQAVRAISGRLQFAVLPEASYTSEHSMLGIGNRFHDSPRLPLALQFIATLRGPVLDDSPIHSKLRIARLFSIKYFQKISFAQELFKVVTVNLPDRSRLRGEIVSLSLLGEASFEGAFNGIASKVVCSRELAVPQ